MPAADMPRSEQHRRAMAAWEPALSAFIALDDAEIARLDGATGPLAGVSVGVKDVIDVAGLATRNGSLACAGAAPAARDAAVVAALRAAGAAIVGKTATTEFAFTDPTATRNPFDVTATPGGSSSGSGAAVGAGLVDLAIGTQTAGSLIRPAAYCGAIGFKPTFGVIPTAGMTPLAPSFDTIGFIAADVPLAARALAVAQGRAASAFARLPRRLALVAPAPDAPMTAPALAALAAARAALEDAGASVADLALPVDFGAMVDDHRIVMLAEAAALHGHLVHTNAPLKPKFRAGLAEGLTIPAADSRAALVRLADARARFWEAALPFDGLITPPTPGAAPDRGDGTGYQHLLTPWTVLGGPLASVPWGSVGSRPLSVMVGARPGEDAAALSLALTLERAAPRAPRPCPR